MKNLTVTLILILCAFTASAQFHCEVYNYNSVINPISKKAVKAEVVFFNHLVKTYNLYDTIAYVFGDDNTSYIFDGNEIDDWKFSEQINNKKLMLKLKKNDDNFQFIASIRNSDSTSTMMESVFHKNLKTFIVKKYSAKQQVPNGAYIELDFDGNIRTKGSYAIKDTMIVSTKKEMDPQTYEMRIIQIKIEGISMRTGIWTYFDKLGNINYTENYTGTIPASNQPITGDLCNLYDWKNVKEQNYYQQFASRIPTIIRIFNYISTITNSEHKITYDISRKGVSYYYDGTLVFGKPVKNNSIEKQFTHKVKNDALVLNYTSNEFGATFNDTKYYGDFNCSIPLDNNRQEIQKFSGNKIERYEMFNGYRDGFYDLRSCDGSILEVGQYCQIDSAYTTEVQSVDVNTFEMQKIVRDHKKYVKKHGIWKTFNAEGKLEKEKDFGSCE